MGGVRGLDGKVVGGNVYCSSLGLPVVLVNNRILIVLRRPMGQV